MSRRFFMDTEFHEYKKQPTVCGIKVGKPIDTIELISIGIVSEDIGGYKSTLEQKQEYREKYNIELKDSIPYHKEYYAICKDFDLKAAWNSYQLDGDGSKTLKGQRVYWLRENVLRPIFDELRIRYDADMRFLSYTNKRSFNIKTLKYLITIYGKTREQIVEEIKDFVYDKSFKDNKGNPIIHDDNWLNGKPELYAYYSSYDWVVFCWLFGRMIDLPEGFPMYCKDLKQELDEKSVTTSKSSTNEKVDWIKKHENYPKQTNEHNTLADAKWNKELYKFLKDVI